MAEVITYKISIDGGAAISTGSTNSYNITSLSPGNHTISVTGTCQHGNTSSDTLSFTIPDTPVGYDSYRFRIAWNNRTDNICIQGVSVDGVYGSSLITAGTTSNGNMSSSELAAAISRNDPGFEKYVRYVEFTITTNTINSLGFHTKRYYQPSDYATLTVWGVRNGTSTFLVDKEIYLNVNSEYTINIT